ncbi:zinc finger BED domain-containing protein 6-like [Osmia bicornis bicornis]|uniref:zinc finger BED domain-containing protein 6-like n=1 Tax=Osmia bicornis bicornis TaxID=1437191 RepID=UPI001EAED697|nr:zinc finger BED domain-containing protein 6-like [Osmia bicornis bicornis]XP_046141904.1 zinc finger BED domain-containing protein 6-like [Osmia bicornis bicornis]XP_046141905.1 zinc finger BED domain-containing protein 6-like [Osmia bicornis bicornis]
MNADSNARLRQLQLEAEELTMYAMRIPPCTYEERVYSSQPSKFAVSYTINPNIRKMPQERKTEDPDLYLLESSTSAAWLPANTNIKKMHQQRKTEDAISKEKELSCRRRTKVLSYFICKAMMPLSIVENKAFQRFVKDLDPAYKCPSRDTLKTEIIDQYNSLSQNLKEKLKNRQNLTITLNVWSNTSQTNKFLGITVHYVDNSNLESIVLDFIKIPPSQIKKSNIVEGVENTLKTYLQNWSIEDNQIVAVITDNAVNISIETKNYYISCFAQTVESIAVNLINKTENFFKIIRSNVKRAIEDSKLSNALRKMLDKRAIRRDCQKTLVLDNPEKWNSTLHMVETYLELSPFLNDKAEFKLDSTEMEILKEAVVILRFVKELTDELSPDHHVTISEMIPLISCFQSSLNELELKTNFGKKSKSILSKEMKKFEKKEESLLCAQATLLDPRFKTIYFTDGFLPLLEKAKRCIITETTKHTTTPQNNSDDSDDSYNVDNESDLPKGIWKEHAKRIYKRTKTSHYDDATINEELSKYLISKIEKDRKQNPFKVWEENKFLYPNLYTLAQKFLSPVVTVLPTEKLFSKTATIIMEETNLSNTLLSKLIFLHNLPEKYWDHEQDIECIDI